MNTFDVVVGGQFGSESKGRVTAELAQKRAATGQQVYTVRVAGPNAGHVVIDEEGNRWALRQIPVGMVADPNAIGIIAAGSEIDLGVLLGEVRQLERAGIKIRGRLVIDNQATILTQQHREAEGGNDGPIQNRIGSTGKGIGAARADRIMRKAMIAADVEQLSKVGDRMGDTGRWLTGLLNDGFGNEGQNSVIIEGTQGYGLGLHAGYYPYCTSSDCRAIDFLAMTGISPWGVRAELAVWVVLRAFPIRVAGNSGPMARETNWEALGLEQELTTVTQKVRRVGHWDEDLARAAVEQNGGSTARVALAMADQLFPEIAGVTDWADIDATPQGREGTYPDGVRFAVADWIEQIEQQTGAAVWSIGTGPKSTLWLPRDAVRFARGGVIPREQTEYNPADTVARLKTGLAGALGGDQ